jgi:hypothetical protein
MRARIVSADATSGTLERGTRPPVSPIRWHGAAWHEPELFPFVIDERERRITPVAVERFSEADLKARAEVQDGVVTKEAVEPVPSSRVSEVNGHGVRRS